MAKAKFVFNRFVLYLQFMKNRIALVNLYLMAAVLFSILFQSVHRYGELFVDYATHSDKHIHAHDDKSHQHVDDDCSVCDFHFWFYVKPDVLTYRFDFPLQLIPYLYEEQALISAFSGSLFSHRGPPQSV